MEIVNYSPQCNYNFAPILNWHTCSIYSFMDNDVVDGYCLDSGSISSLPDELLSHIFYFLPGARDRGVCACVSKRWLMLQSQLHWKQFRPKCSEPIEGSSIAYPNGKGVKRKGRHISTHLSRCLEGTSDVSLAAIALGMQVRGPIGKLSIRQGSITDTSLSAIGVCCTGLRNLCLWDCPYIKDQGLTFIAKQCKLLEKLSLFKCPMIGDLALQEIANNCLLLSFLSLDECQNISNASLKDVGSFCSNLLSLNIRNCPQIGDDGIMLAISGSKNLKRIRLANLKVSNKCFDFIVSNAKALLSLKIENINNASEECFMLLGKPQGMESLKKVSVCNLKNFTDTSLVMMAKACHGLKHVSITKCSRLTEEGILRFVQCAASLEFLQVESSVISKKCSVPTFSTGLDTTRELKFQNHNGIGTKDILLRNVSLVKSFSLAHTSGVGNSFLFSMGYLCPYLRHLDISGLKDITDTDVLGFLSNVTEHLQSINLSGCVNITDEVICRLAEKCNSSLKTIILCGCRNVTDKGIKAIAKKCVFLESLVVFECKITDQGVAALHLGAGLKLCSLSSKQSEPFSWKGVHKSRCKRPRCLMFYHCM